jgi:hypothetical protein
MSYLRAEGAMRSGVWAELPSYHVANVASESLLRVVEQAGFDPYEGDKPPASYWRAKALLYLGVITVRATRAAMAVIACGYEPESMGHKRTVTEAHSRAQRVVGDESGEYARQWLQARAGKPAKAVSGFAPDDFFHMMSHSSHADHRGVRELLGGVEPGRLESHHHAAGEEAGGQRFIAHRVRQRDARRCVDHRQGAWPDRSPPC